jgi:hypothetical protein
VQLPRGGLQKLEIIMTININRNLTETERFQETLDRFVAETGTLPPKGIYYMHPAHKAVASALRIEMRKVCPSRPFTQSLIWNAAEYGTLHVLRMITSSGKKLLFEGGDYKYNTDYLKSIVESRKELLRVFYQLEMLKPREKRNNLYEFMFEGADLKVLRVATALIAPTPPQSGPNVRKYRNAWYAVREITPPQHAALGNPIAWMESWS